MALTLPHDLVFTPLDILTAEEMNNLMDDLNYIGQQFPITSANLNSGAVTSAKIANTAVTASKIDWSSLGFAQTSSSIGGQGVTTTGTTLLTLNISSIPIGSTFVVIGQIQANVQADGGGDATARLQYGSETRTLTMTNAWNTALTIVGIFTKVSTNTVTLGAQKSNSGTTVTASWPQMLAFRVG